MLGFKKNDKTYILINRKKQIQKGRKNIKKYQKGSVIGKESSKIEKEKKEIKEGNANEEEEEKEELKIEEEERVLMLVKDNTLSEVHKIEPNFYENLDYAFVFKDNISL